MGSFDHIPQELRERRQWVSRAGKVLMDPKFVDEFARVNDPSTWGTFDEAVRHAERYSLSGVGFVLTEDDPFFLVDLDRCVDPETGEITEFAAETIENFSGTYIERSRSGTGVHIIGRGNKPGARCKNKERGVEVYDHARFVALTGDLFPGAANAIKDCQRELDELYYRVFGDPADEHKGSLTEPKSPPMGDEEILRRIRSSRSADKFRRLFDEGDTSEFGGDWSSADQALVNIISFWTQDVEQIDRIFRQSALCRNKWINRPDYRRSTIEFALSGKTQFYGAASSGVDYEVTLLDDIGDDAALHDIGAPPELDGGNGEPRTKEPPSSCIPGDHDGYDDPADGGDASAGPVPDSGESESSDADAPGGCLDEATSPEPTLGLQGRELVGRAITEGVEPPSMLVKGLLYEAKIHAWNGEAGAGKTNLALWAAWNVVKAGLPVLYLDEEGSVDMVGERLEGLGADPARLDELFHYYQSPAVTLDEKSLAELAHTTREVRPALVVFDSWADFLALEGLNENDAMDITRWIKLIAYPLRDFGASVLLLDHLNKEAKGKGARGSTAKLAKLDASYRVQKSEDFDRHHVGKVRFVKDKDRLAALGQSFTFRVGGDGRGGFVCYREGDVTVLGDDGLSLNGRTALDALEGGGLTYSEWKKAAGLASSSFQKSKTELMEKEAVRQDSKDKRYYQIAAENSPTHYDSPATHVSSGSDSPTLRGVTPGVSESPMSAAVSAPRHPIDPTDVGDEVA